MFIKQFGLSAFATLCLTSAYAGTYTNDFNTNPVTADPNFVIRPSAIWRASGSFDGSGYVSITDAVGSQQGTIVLPDFDSGTTVLGFKFYAKVRIGGGSGRPADGFSVNFGDDPGSAIGEEGTSTGVSVNIDTWDNGNGDGPGLDVKYNGVMIAHKRFAGSGPGTATPGPYCAKTETDAAGNPISLETDPAGTPAPGTWADLEITLSSCGTLSVTYKGIQIYKDLVIGYVPRAGRFVIGARTGGAWDNHWIDNIGVTTDTTDPADGPARVITATPNSNPVLRDMSEVSPIQFVIDYHLGFGDSAIDQSTIKLTVNGTEVAPTITDDPLNGLITVAYTPPGNGYTPDSKVEAVLTYSTGTIPSVTCTARKIFHVTPVPAMTDYGQSLFIEAEDFNYLDTADSTAGHYFDFPTANGAYNTLPAKHDVDYHLGASNPDSPLYRVLNPPNGISVPGAPGDFNRAGTTITTDYKVGWNDEGDWYNYTRTFPAGTYKVYGRFASGGLDTHVELAKVTSDPTAGSQTAVPLGTFDGEATAGWDTFCFIPLGHASGDRATLVHLDGLTTLRITTLPLGNDDFNYLTIVPVAPQVVRPVLASVSPKPQEAPLRDNITVKAVITDQDTAVVASSIRLFLDGAELPAVQTDTPGGAEAQYHLPTSVSEGTHTLVVIYSDNAPVPVSQTNRWSFTTGPFKSGNNTLFIEAEDFNYSNDGVTGGLHANFGDPDCSLLGKNGVRGVDYQEGNPNDGGATPAYRAPTWVEVAKPGTDGFQRGDHTISCSYIVGWNDPGDWYNYTRDFGTGGRYNVYARLASGGNPESADLSKVVTDPTRPCQITESLGQFNSPATGNWDLFHTVPLRDSQGNLANVKLTGLTTLRFTTLPGNLDVNYLAFVKSDIQFIPASLVSVEPRNGSDYARAPKVTAILAEEDAPVVDALTKVFFDGADVSSSASVVHAGGRATITYQAPLGSPVGTLHTVRVDWKDGQTPPNAGTYSWSYREGIYNAESNLFIEAEDFNVDGGNYFPSTPGHPFNEKGLYNGLGASSGVDFHDSGNGDVVSDVYRVTESPNVGMAALSDGYRAGAGPRPGFDCTPDYKVGWTDSGFPDWYHYTRDFGAGGTYQVYARLAHGDAAATIGGKLDLVDDPAVPTTITPLGSFRAPTTGGWDTFTYVPLKDPAGQTAIVSLSGIQTLRYTVEAWGGDFNYLMLVPAGPKLKITRSGNDIIVEWAAGRLQSAGQITGTWSDVLGAAPPSHTLTGAAGAPGMRFFRAVNP